MATPRLLDHTPADYVDTLWRWWVDPLEVALAAVALEAEMEALKARLAAGDQPRLAPPPGPGRWPERRD